MALRAVPDHPKFSRLKTLLRLNKACTLGYLETLWHFCGRYTPQGNVGKYTDEDIEAWLEWDGEEGALIAALVKARWLDRHDEHRLVVHDWHRHADDATRMALKRAKIDFLTYREDDQPVVTQPDPKDPEPLVVPTPSKETATESTRRPDPVATVSGLPGAGAVPGAETVPGPEPERTVSNETGGKPPKKEKKPRGKKTPMKAPKPLEGELAPEPPGPDQPPFQRSEWVLRTAKVRLKGVDEKFDLSPVFPRDVVEMVRADSPIQMLIGLYGEESAVGMFVHAWKSWKEGSKPTWYSVWRNRDTIRSSILAEGKTPGESTKTTKELQEDEAKRRRELATAAEVTRQREAEMAEFERRRNAGLIPPPSREIPEPYQEGDSFR